MQQRSRRGVEAQQNIAPVEALLEDGDEESWTATRMPSSARRYQGLADIKFESGRAPADVARQPTVRATPVSERKTTAGIPIRRASAHSPAAPVASPARRRMPSGEIRESEPSLPSAELSAQTRSWRPHWLFLCGLAMLVMIVGWLAFSALTSWWQVTQDDWHYGRPRTYQVDTVVGHNDSVANPSHFIALNVNRRIQIIEFPGGDATKAKIYLGPLLIGPGQDLAPVTLDFRDVNGDGRLDMIVTVQDSHLAFINENGAFRPAKPGENLKL